MFHSLTRRGPSEPLLHYGTVAALGATIVIAFAFAMQPESSEQSHPLAAASSCSNDSWPYIGGNCAAAVAGEMRSIRLVAPDRIGKTSVYTTAAAPLPAKEPVKTTIAPIAPVQPESAIAQSAPTIAEEDPPAAPSMEMVRSVTPRARAQARPRPRSPERPRTPGLGPTPSEKSHTGAGGSFDAVH